MKHSKWFQSTNTKTSLRDYGRQHKRKKKIAWKIHHTIEENVTVSCCSSAGDFSVPMKRRGERGKHKLNEYNNEINLFNSKLYVINSDLCFSMSSCWTTVLVQRELFEFSRSSLSQNIVQEETKKNKWRSVFFRTHELYAFNMIGSQISFPEPGRETFRQEKKSLRCKKNLLLVLVYVGVFRAEGKWKMFPQQNVEA